MGIVRATGKAFGGMFADAWLEVIEADNMSDHTVVSKGVLKRKGQNKKGSEDVVSNGSKIRVYENQFMILVDGGKIVDYTAEPGEYTVNNSTAPSMFSGSFGDSIKDAFNRIKFGGETPASQKVYFINLQEIKGIKFGTKNPINYYDTFYNAELFLRAHGTYSIKIMNPLQFFAEAVPRNADNVDVEDINEQYMSEFLEALGASINQMSADGVSISKVLSKSGDLSRYMANALDENWSRTRGIEIQSVGIASISYDEESKKLINMRNEGAMLSDPAIAQGYMVKNMTDGMKNAGSNAGGAMQGFMGFGMGANMMGNMMGGFNQMAQNTPEPRRPEAPQQAAPVQQAAVAPNSWTCECGTVNTGKFCSECGKQSPVFKTEWKCSCGAVNTGKFCSECGSPRV